MAKKLCLIIMLTSLIYLSLTNNLSASANDYLIDSYDVDIVVNDDNSYDIIETINANFKFPKHGIFRTIPLKNRVVRNDGSKEYNIAKIKNVAVNTMYDASSEGGNYKIKIGSPNSTIMGPKEYRIKYTYDIGKDSTKKFDELYYNIIGEEWDTTISNITFKITMPKEFDKSKVGFSAGYIGSTNSSDVEYKVEGNIIHGKYNGTINPGEAITVRIELPEGYFENATSRSKTAYLMFIIPVTGLLISYYIWKKYGKDDEVIETVEFYPPEGFNSLEVGFLYKGEATTEDVVSLLIYLADKGYLRITEIEEKILFSTYKEFKIEKLKEYDGDNASEKAFMEGLFKKKKVTPIIRVIGPKDATSNEQEDDESEKNAVTTRDLYNNFYRTMAEILGKVNSKKNKNIIFEKISSKHYRIQIIFVILSLLCIFTVPTLAYGTFEDLGLTIFLILFYIPFYAVGISGGLTKGTNIFWLGFTIFHSSVFFSALPIFTAITNETVFLLGFLIGILSIAGIIACIKAMPKRTKYGTEVLGQIKGFKTFLELAEKEKLEELVMEDPEYFYNILPYTYVLGVSDKWIEKFERIGFQQPDWYDSRMGFSAASFGSAMNSVMTSTQNAMSSSPSSGSSGGGSSGGGSSGGGSGGGGGGSW